MSKITISLEETLIIEGKKHAKNTGRTFSGLLAYGLKKELGGKQ